MMEARAPWFESPICAIQRKLSSCTTSSTLTYKDAPVLRKNSLLIYQRVECAFRITFCGLYLVPV